MNRWTIAAFTLLATLIAASVALTQPPPPRGGSGPGGPGGPGGGPFAIERMLDDLKLTDKQKDQAEEALKAHQEKMQKQIEHAHADLLKQMKDVLTDDQYKQFKDALDTQGPGRGPGGPGGRGAGPGGPGGRGGPGGGRPGPGGPGAGLDRIVDDLKLTDKQKDKAADALKSHHETMRKVNEQGRDDLLKGLKDVLTDSQFTKFKDALANQGPPRGPGGPGAAGGPPGGPGAAGGPGGLERVLDDMKLTKKERDKAEEVLQVHHEKVRKALDQARDEMLKQMKDVLSDEHYKQFKDALENQGPPPPPPGRE